jgi:hypothetical protein
VQAIELPVIASNVGRMNYGLIAGKTSFVVEVGNIIVFVEYLLLLRSVKQFE